jgi:hypothetical protein
MNLSSGCWSWRDCGRWLQVVAISIIIALALAFSPVWAGRKYGARISHDLS